MVVQFRNKNLNSVWRVIVLVFEYIYIYIYIYVYTSKVALHNVSPQCHQWRQLWHYDNSCFSMGFSEITCSDSNIYSVCLSENKWEYYLISALICLHSFQFYSGNDTHVQLTWPAICKPAEFRHFKKLTGTKFRNVCIESALLCCYYCCLTAPSN